MRGSWDRLLFIMGIPISVRYLDIKTGPSALPLISAARSQYDVMIFTFRITDALWRESIVHRWISSQSDSKTMFSLMLPWTSFWTKGQVVGDIRRSCDVTVMPTKSGGFRNTHPWKSGITGYSRGFHTLPRATLLSWTPRGNSESIPWSCRNRPTTTGTWPSYNSLYLKQTGQDRLSVIS